MILRQENPIPSGPQHFRNTQSPGQNQQCPETPLSESQTQSDSLWGAHPCFTQGEDFLRRKSNPGPPEGAQQERCLWTGQQEAKTTTASSDGPGNLGSGQKLGHTQWLPLPTQSPGTSRVQTQSRSMDGSLGLLQGQHMPA